MRHVSWRAIAKSVFVCVHMCRPVDDIRAWWVVSLREEQTDDGDMVILTVETWWLNQRGECQGASGEEMGDRMNGCIVWLLYSLCD